MAALKKIAKQFRLLLSRSSAERDLDDEIRLHIELETEKNVKLGMSAGDARREAMRVFGGVEVAKEAHRDGRGTRWVEDCLADVRFSLRAMLHTPAIAIPAIVTLALGIAANTAIFSVVDAVILRPLPFRAPSRLMELSEENPDRAWHLAQVAPANFLDWSEQVRAFDGAAAYIDFKGNATLTGEGEPRLLPSTAVTGGFFSVLGVEAEAGRVFREDETWNTSPRVAMLSHRAWMSVFGGRRDIIGRTVELDGQRIEVVGIVPARFVFPGLDADVWKSTAWPKSNRAQVWFRRAHFIRGFARLRGDATIESASAEFQSVVRRLQGDFPETNTHMGASMTPIHEFLVGNVRRPLLVLLTAVALLLLIACANVGNLLLVQAAGREREMALRLALGAGRFRLVRQAFTESLVMSAIGGGAGLLLGWWGTRALAAMQPDGMLPVTDVHMSWSVVGYVVAITTVSGVLFGVAPALFSGGRAPADALKDGARGAAGGRRLRKWGNALAVAEVALALLLTLGAGLLVRSFDKLRSVNPGFDASGVLAVSLDLPGAKYDSATKITAFYDELVRRARAQPGVDAAAVVSSLPVSGYPWSSDFSVFGQTGPGAVSQVVHRELSPDYFSVMRVRLMKGRMLTDADRAGAAMVVLINESLEKQFFRGVDPIGTRISFDRVPDSTSVWRTIVGVVGDERQGSVAEDPHPEFIAPAGQDPRGAMTLVVRTRSDPISLAPAMRGIVSALDANLAITDLTTMTDVRARSLARERFLATLMLVFAVVGLTLAVVGVYGVIAQLARGRTREMGIRIALGAPARDVQWLVVRHGMLLTTAGVVVGLGGAMFATRAMTSLLFQVDPIDPPTFLAVSGMLVAAALVAAWIPAFRASRVDPLNSLRAE